MRIQAKVCCVMPARNEESYIEATLQSLKEQSIPVDLIIVIDDESTDNTFEIANKYAHHVVKSGLPSMESKIDNFNLAEVYNRGFAELDKVTTEFDYLLILDADTILPPNYCESMIKYMENKNLSFSSGMINGEEQSKNVRGSGRILKRKLYELMDKRDPVNYGFDTYPAAICLINHLEYGVNKECKYDVPRPTSTNYSYKAFITSGRSFRAYGYIFPYTFGILFKMAIRNISPKILFAGMYGYLTLKRSRKYPSGHQKSIQKVSVE